MIQFTLVITAAGRNNPSNPNEPALSYLRSRDSHTCEASITKPPGSRGSYTAQSGPIQRSSPSYFSHEYLEILAINIRYLEFTVLVNVAPAYLSISDAKLCKPSSQKAIAKI